MASYTKNFTAGTTTGLQDVVVPRVQRGGNLTLLEIKEGGSTGNGVALNESYVCQPGEQIVKVKAMGNGLNNVLVALWGEDGVRVTPALGTSIEDADELVGPFSKAEVISPSTYQATIWIKKGGI